MTRALMGAAALLLATASWTPLAEAQTDADRATAQTLFDEGKAAKDAGDFRTACEKFRGSQKLDPAVGTQLNLADCYEQLGKTASAWVNFIEASESADAGDRRAEFARERAQELEPKLSKITITVAAPVPGLTIKRGDTTIAEEAWGSAVPIDPGEYVIAASAPGYVTWRKRVEVGGQADRIEVDVPELSVDEGDTDLPPDDGEKDSATDSNDGSSQRIAGGVIMGLGAAGVAVGAILAGVAHSKAAESEEGCLPDNPNLCTTQEAVDLRGEAQGLQIGYVASFAVGGAALIAGLATLLTAGGDDGGSTSDDSALLSITPDGGFVGYRTRF